MSADNYLLRCINNYKETWYFVHFGAEYRNIRLIEHTTQDLDKAKKFDTYPEALAAWKLAGEPPGWETIPCPERK